MKRIEHPEWFFMWKEGVPYITTICGWSRRAVMNEAEIAQGLKWKQIYRKGGRCIKCGVIPK